MPEIPLTWDDISWRPDGCPLWRTPSGIQVYTDYEKLEDRPFPEIGGRYQVVNLNDRSADLVTDDWTVVLSFVESKEYSNV